MNQKIQKKKPVYSATSAPKDKEGKGKKKKKKKSALREWIDAAIFAVIAASIIRTFFFEAYTIPTPSMEKTLLVHDFLFVNKLSYGPRVPMTPLAVPFTMSTVPILNIRSYSTWPKFDYHRLPGFGDIKRNDVVVFNFPDGDTVLINKEGVAQEADYYAMIRQYGREYIYNNYTIATRPVDRKENYIKRCVGIAGDTLSVRDGVVYINGDREPIPPHSQKYYYVQTDGSVFNVNRLKELEITMPTYEDPTTSTYSFNLSRSDSAELSHFKMVKSIVRVLDTTVTPAVFPHDTTHFKWSPDQYGPIYIPKEGATVRLNLSNIALYKRLIDVYEDNDLAVRDGKIYINGKQSDSYTFKMNYYWMMGDNRDNSLDSRYWGFVPESHVVGEAWFIWMSYDEDGIRWSRLFNGIH